MPRLVPQRGGQPHPGLLPAGRAEQVRAGAGGQPLTVLRTRTAVPECVTSPVWVMAGVTRGGGLRTCPVTGAGQHDKRAGMLTMHPPAHTVCPYRVSRLLASGAAGRERSPAEDVARSLAGGPRGRKTAGLAADDADPFAGAVICRSLGVAGWPDILAGSDNAVSPVRMPGGVQRAEAGWQETCRFCASVINGGLARPGATAAQAAAAFGGFTLPQVAHPPGNIGNRYPAARQPARRTPAELLGDYRAAAAAGAAGERSWAGLTGLIPNTRALYPTGVPRRAARDTHLDGWFCAEGTLVLPPLVAGATDPASPGPPPGGIAFSFGRHRCPAAHLARMRVLAASRVLFAVHPRARLAAGGRWEGGWLPTPRPIMVTGRSR